MHSTIRFPAVVAAAGIGSRMAADKPKQYLSIAGKTVLEHTLETLHQHPNIGDIVVVVHPEDAYFQSLPLATAPWLTTVIGGKERADSVLAGLKTLNNDGWVLVHDAARPCISHQDIDRLLAIYSEGIGGILATPVRDTMKRASIQTPAQIAHSEDREGLWHALTPQFFPRQHLIEALEQCLEKGLNITDEASAMEQTQQPVKLVEGAASNIKITRPADLALAEFYLSRREM